MLSIPLFLAAAAGAWAASGRADHWAVLPVYFCLQGAAMRQAMYNDWWLDFYALNHHAPI